MRAKMPFALVINVISRETRGVEAQRLLYQREVDMPGYVDSVEKDYEGSPWRTERIWLIPQEDDQ